MLILKLAKFNCWAKSEKLSDEKLNVAVDEISKGLVDADLGRGLVKKRVARMGKGKSGGFRTIIAFKQDERAIFLFGFLKNEKDNIDSKQLKELRDLAKIFLNMPEEKIKRLIKTKQLIKVK